MLSATCLLGTEVVAGQKASNTVLTWIFKLDFDFRTQDPKCQVTGVTLPAARTLFWFLPW